MIQLNQSQHQGSHSTADPVKGRRLSWPEQNSELDKPWNHHFSYTSPTTFYQRTNHKHSLALAHATNKTNKVQL